MTCLECENHDRYVRDAQEAIETTQKQLKRLDQMTYSEVAEFDRTTGPLRLALRQAKASRKRHIEKCEASS